MVLPAVQHDTSADESVKDTDTLSRLRTALIRVLRISPESREPVCDALELLEVVQKRLETLQTEPPADQPKPARRGRKVQGYEVQNSPEGQFLAEHREGEGVPIRCPREVYEATADELAAASQAVHFDHLLERVSQRLSQRQPDYRLRVAMRFWLHHKLIERSRTRYRPAERATFRQRARELWQRAAEAKRFTE